MIVRINLTVSDDSVIAIVPCGIPFRSISRLRVYFRNAKLILHGKGSRWQYYQYSKYGKYYKDAHYDQLRIDAHIRIPRPLASFFLLKVEYHMSLNDCYPRYSIDITATDTNTDITPDKPWYSKVR
jgi:hypothetical protein